MKQSVMRMAGTGPMRLLGLVLTALIALPNRGGAQPAPAGPRLLYGVNVVWGDNGGGAGWDRDGGKRARALVDLMKSAGVTNTRVGIAWGDVERVRGRYDWSGTDRFLRFVRSQGLVLTCVVAVIPDWAGDPDPAVRGLFAARGVPHLRGVMAPDPKFYADFGRFAYALGQRYRGVIQRWEFWNEPDGMGMPIVVRNDAGQPVDLRYGGDPAVYTRLLAIFSRNVKRADPSCQVAIGGLATHRTDFLRGIYAHGGQKFFDAVALHPYSTSGPLNFRWIEECRRVLEQKGDGHKKFWLTEWGWSTYPDDPGGVTEGHQARLVRESLQEMRRRPYIEQACYHTLNDWRTDEGDPLSLMSMGLCRRDLRPRPAFMAFQEAALGRSMPERAARRVAWVADLPASLAVAHVDVGMDRVEGALSRGWLGVSFPALSELQSLLPRMKALGAPFVRLNPFAAREIMALSADGTPEVRWEQVDALLERVAQEGGQTILAMVPPVGLSPDRWKDLVTQAVQRYGRETRFRVVRWEMAVPQRTAGETEHLMRVYAPVFARVVRTLLPTTPVGFHVLVGGDPIGAMYRLASACTEAGITFHSFSWRSAGSAEELGPVVRRLRGVLAAFPGLRHVYLLPECTAFASPAQVMAVTARMKDIAPASEPNGAPGFLIAAEGLSEPSGERLWRALEWINRVAGSRLPVSTDWSGVRCLAARHADGATVLAWREDTDTQDTAVHLRLRDLPLQSRHGLRVSRYVLSGAGAVAVTDTPGGAGGGLVLPVVLRAGEAARLELVPRRSPAPLQVSLSVPRFVWYSGESPEVLVTIRNVSDRLQPSGIMLSSPVPGVVPVALAKTPSVLLPPGRSRLVRFRLNAPAVAEDTDVTVNVRVGADSHAATGWRVAASLAAELETPRLDMEALDDPVRARVRVTNRGKTGQMVTVRAGDEARVEALIPGGGQQTLQVQLKAPERTPGLYAVPITLENGGRVLSALSVLVGVPVACRYMRAQPEIDADLKEWTDAFPIGMGQAEQVRLKMWGGLRDLSAIAYTGWDTRYLYVACAVADDVPGTSYPAMDLWRGDSLQVAVSALRRSAGAGGGYGPGDHEFGFALIAGEPVAVRFHGENGRVGPVSEIRVAVRRDGDRMFYEVAIPWKELAPVRPEPGTVLGLSLLVNDDDGHGRGYIEWGGGIGDVKRPEQFPPLRLVR
ncbi:MAG: sugar-binding protein [Chloroherpetonaceae bacterium]|nr:hypothetical protein [Chthonomonadaceae bacterium]MDW8207186.1 sugar-binding protein [Chloroherpetonaceae bacterium]